MNRSAITRWAAIVGVVLAIMGETAWAQSAEQSVNVTGRILFGYGELTQIPASYNESGPAATLETDVNGFWRDPRILEFDVRPIVTVGQAVPGTEIGNAYTGVSATGLILQGSPFPLSLSFSRFGSSYGEGYKSDTVTNPNQDILNGAESKTTNTMFDAHWTLRFPSWPLVSLDYRDTDTNSMLPEALGSQEDHHLHDFLSHVNYSVAGWDLAGRYMRSGFTTTAPNILDGGELTDSGTTSDLGFSASRWLPLQSNLGVNVDDSKSTFNTDGLETNLSVKTANVTLTSEPLERLNTLLQMQYVSNTQAAEVQQALAGTGVLGSGSPVATTGISQTGYLAPYSVVTVSGGGVYRLGHGFSLQGNVGDSHTSLDSGASLQWTGGLNYSRKWRSGSLSTSYAHSQFSTEVEVVNGSAATGETSTSVFSQHTNLNTDNVILAQQLPDQFRLSTSGHVSVGTLTEYGSTYPYHDYGGIATVGRPVGQWTLSGNVNLEEIATNAPGTYNRSDSKSVFASAAYRGLTLSGGYLFGSGLAEQVGNSLVYLNQPVGPVLGVPVLSSTRGTSVTGSYRSRRGRLMLEGYWYRFNYSTENAPSSGYNLFNVHASYKLRRLRLIAGFVKQSELVGQANTFGSRLMYFQVERVFRLY